MDLTLAIAILASVLSVANFVLGRKDKAVKEVKESVKENNTPLIEYQIDEMKRNYQDIANDIKEIKKMLYENKESIRNEVRNAMEEHIRVYHSKGE